MAFELPFPPFPHDSRGVPFIATPDDNNGYAVPSSQYFKKLVGDKYIWTPVSADDPMPTGDATAQGKLADILAKISADPATQTTLAAILAKIIAAPATEAKQTALNALIGEVQTTPTANTLLARLKNLETKVDAIIADGLKLSGSIVATKSVRRTGNLANGVSEIFLERNKETIIHNLIVSYSIDHWQFRMLPYWWDGGNWKTVESIGKLGAHIPANSYVVFPGMLTVAGFNEMLWEVISNTDTAKVVRLKNTPLRVRGVKLVLENYMPSDDADMSAVCFYSEVN